MLIASGRDADEIERARSAVRAQIAFYASTPAYRGVLDSCGRGALHPELHALSRSGDWRAMAALVDDALLEAVAVCAPPEALGERLAARCAGFADRVSLVAPWQPDAGAWADVRARAAEWPGLTAPRSAGYEPGMSDAPPRLRPPRPRRRCAAAAARSGSSTGPTCCRRGSPRWTSRSPRRCAACSPSALEIDDLGYPLDVQPDALPAAFAERMEARFGWRPDPRGVEVLTDVVQGIYVAIDQFSAPGEGVVVQTPVYAPFLIAVRELERRLVENPLVAGATRYEIDFDQLRRAIDPSTRVFLLCNPQNPTGRVFERARARGARGDRDRARPRRRRRRDPRRSGLRRAAAHPVRVARARGRGAHASRSPRRPRPSTSRACAARSRTSAATTLRKRFDRVPRHIRGGLGSLGQAATLAAWREGQPWLDAVLALPRRQSAQRRALRRRAAAGRPPASSPRRPSSPGSTAARSSSSRRRSVLPRACARGALGRRRLRHAGPRLRAPQLRDLATAARRDRHAHREIAAGARRAVIRCGPCRSPFAIPRSWASRRAR